MLASPQGALPSTLTVVNHLLSRARGLWLGGWGAVAEGTVAEGLRGLWLGD